jgi:hypothetical protein
LHGRSSVLRFTYTVCLVSFFEFGDALSSGTVAAT